MLDFPSRGGTRLWGNGTRSWSNLASGNGYKTAQHHPCCPESGIKYSQTTSDLKLHVEKVIKSRTDASFVNLSVSLRLDVHIQKLQTACPLERTRLQFKMCIRSSWEESVWRWEFWVTPLTWSSPRAIFLSSCPTTSLKIMVGTPSPCLPTTEHALLRYGLGATTLPSAFPSHVTSVTWESLFRGATCPYWMSPRPSPTRLFLGTYAALFHFRRWHLLLRRPAPLCFFP